MIPKFLAMLLASLVWSVTSIAQAGSWSGEPPILYHKPETGELRLTNTAVVTNSALFTAVFFHSASHNLLAPSVNPIPGSVMDSSYLPVYLIFLNTPVGTFNLGAIVKPGTPSDDLSVTFVPDISSAHRVGGTVVSVPEPAPVVCGVVSMVGLALAKRRQK